MSGKSILQSVGIGGRVNDAGTPKSDAVLMLSVAMLEPDPNQPRKTFDEQELQQLSESLVRDGQIQPIVVRRTGVGGRYQIVAGERRWRACKLAGITRIKALEIEERNGEDSVRTVQLLENLQRAEMSPLETAEAYRGLMERWGCSQAELARKLSIGTATVSRALALLQTPGESGRKAVPADKAKRKKPATDDKRRAVVLELAAGTVRVKRGHTLEQLADELRRMVADQAKDAA